MSGETYIQVGKYRFYWNSDTKSYVCKENELLSIRPASVTCKGHGYWNFIGCDNQPLFINRALRLDQLEEAFEDAINRMKYDLSNAIKVQNKILADQEKDHQSTMERIKNRICKYKRQLKSLE